MKVGKKISKAVFLKETREDVRRRLSDRIKDQLRGARVFHSEIDIGQMEIILPCGQDIVEKCRSLLKDFQKKDLNNGQGSSYFLQIKESKSRKRFFKFELTISKLKLPEEEKIKG